MSDWSAWEDLGRVTRRDAFTQEYQQVVGDICQRCGHYLQWHQHGREEKTLKWCRGSGPHECDCEGYLHKESTQEEDLRLFKTSDGYSLLFLEGLWVDSFDPETRDMAFLGDTKGPVEAGGQRVAGTLICCGRFSQDRGYCDFHEAPGVMRRRPLRRGPPQRLLARIFPPTTEED